MLKILDLYIARTLLGTTFISLSVLVGLSELIKFIEQMKRVGTGSYDMTAAAVYVLLSLPREIEQFFPMATLIGGLVGMGLLASHSELVVMQASGMSRWDITKSAMKSAFVMVLFVMAIGEWVAPQAEAKAKEVKAQAISGGSLIASDRLIWAKDGDNFVSIGEVVSNAILRDIDVYEFDESLSLKKVMSAKSAVYMDEAWEMQDVATTQFADFKIQTQTSSEAVWNSSLTPDKLSVYQVKPEALSIRGLMDYVSYLESGSQDAARYKLALWRKVLQPISIGVMLLMALSFIFGPLRSVTMGARIIMGVLAGFGFFIANEVFGSMSLVFNLPPVLGALLPSVVFAGIATHLLRKP
ncbi:LPS export ABC transporter permease LptG [Aestuariibacter sp. AA17]|uniref:LPS export ABC transporter permease LptG n=1 Tax=Fluctibacter corallii TaxID=2984329 RepID=A0ABT3A792_9ALTE|nr:LPS export ABC transporter permease LptG [Aestuariibacter sp. AA17]MCV2884473.1 LPS export ABC transporter permease LptG [Aestuariibacter sp. AA17]